MLTPINTPRTQIHHDLSGVLKNLQSIEKRHELLRHPEYLHHEPEITRIISGLEWDNGLCNEPPKESIRVVSWNIERGKNWRGVIDYLQTHPELKKADILLLTETDIGMGRTGNANVPKEIAHALKMNYCFGNAFLTLNKGDESEQGHEEDNTLALHGCTILSKFPIQSAMLVPLYNSKDYFQHVEKRFGQRQALVCTIPIGNLTYDFAALHLEVHTSSKQRARQVDSLAQALSHSKSDGQLIGGDFNTSTYDLETKWDIFKNLSIKLFFMGIKKTLHHYMHPDKFFEKKVFKVLEKYGFDIEDYNDRTKGTFFYDRDDEIGYKKAQKFLPDFILNFIMNKIANINRFTPLRLDWCAGKNLWAENPQVIDLPQVTPALSDHCPITVDIRQRLST